MISRAVRLLVGITVGMVVFAYALLSVFARRPLHPTEFAIFAAAVLRATPAHVTGSNPVETLRFGGHAFGSPVEEFILTMDTQEHTLPLPPHTARAQTRQQTQRFITFATSDELNEYFATLRSRLGGLGFRYNEREQLGSARVFQGVDFVLSADLKFYRGTRVRELRYSAWLRPGRSAVATPRYPTLKLSPALSARFAGLPAVGAPRRVHAPSDLLDAAREVVGFLRGEVRFDQIRLADTVTLYLGLEGGGFRNEVSRRRLRNPANWKVRQEWGRGFDYSFVPPKALTVLKMQVGRRSNCGFRPLAPTSKELARFPHVGVLFTPVHMESCLQSWNFTLIFDANEKPPTLIAVVYDQFEW